MWASFEDVVREWDGLRGISCPASDADVLFAGYCSESYEGYAFMVFRSADGTLWDVRCSHCSCNGLDEFTPEETSLAGLEALYAEQRPYELSDVEHNDVRLLIRGLVAEDERRRRIATVPDVFAPGLRTVDLS